jgi:hypothetical protein
MPAKRLIFRPQVSNGSIRFARLKFLESEPTTAERELIFRQASNGNQRVRFIGCRSLRLDSSTTLYDSILGVRPPRSARCSTRFRPFFASLPFIGVGGVQGCCQVTERGVFELPETRKPDQQRGLKSSLGEARGKDARAKVAVRAGWLGIAQLEP